MLHMSPVAMRLGLLGFVLGGAVLASGSVRAADLDDTAGYYRAPPPYAEPREPPPMYREGGYEREEFSPPSRWQRFGGDSGGCRLVLERRPDGYGREIVRRVRVCDDGQGRRPHHWRESRRQGYEPQPYATPRPFYRAPPDSADDGEE